MQDQNDQSQPVDEVDVTKVTGTIQKVDPDLTLWGLRLIYRRNRNR